MHQIMHPSVAASIIKWHNMVEAGDFSDLPSLLHPSVIFRSPMAFNPYGSAEAVTLIIHTVFGVFKDFAYHRTFATDDGLSIVLEFSANVDGKQLKGIDLIRFDEGGKIVEFEVMIRPFNALHALGEQMAGRLAQVLPAYKMTERPAKPSSQI